MLFGSSYWFVIAYIGLYILSPVLNAFVEKSSPKQLSTVIISFFAAEFIYGWVINSESFARGYSIVSFIGLYLLARYLRLYPTKVFSKCPQLDFVLYLILAIIPATISFIGINIEWIQSHMLFYSSPFAVAGSTFLFICFTKIKLKNTIINWIAFSTFSAYLIHLHPIVIPHFTELMRNLSGRFSPLSYSCIVVLLAFTFIVICTVIDQIRIYSWNLIFANHFRLINKQS